MKNQLHEDVRVGISIGIAARRHRLFSRFIFGLCVLITLLDCSVVFAFKLTPMKMVLSPSGRGASGAFTVSNQSAETLAVDIHFLTRSMNPEGQEVNENVDKLFMVFPPQFALKPNKTQTVRVKWVGKTPVDKELAFRLVAEQLPISLSKGPENGVSLNVALRYLAAVYVRPKGVKEEIEMLAGIMENGSERRLLLDFENQGSKHAFLKNLSVKVNCGGTTITLSPEQIDQIQGENLLAGSRRRYELPWPAGLPSGTPEGSFSYDR